jgi:hypothetical protein
MNFFIKYKLQINIVLLFFWLFIIYEALLSPDFKYQKLLVPILFIILALINIYKGLNSNKPKSED